MTVALPDLSLTSAVMSIAPGPQRARQRWFGARVLVVSCLLGLGSVCVASGPATPAQPMGKDVAPQRWSELADTVFQHATSDQGLQHNHVMAIAEDSDGFMWVGTQGGLARWDGYRFKPYLPDPKVASALPDNYVHTLYTDGQGRLWVGTGSGGLARYDRDQDSFVRIPIGPQGISHKGVNAVVDDGAGGIWVGTHGGGLDHLDNTSNAIQHWRHDPKDPNSLPHNVVTAVLRGRNTRLWVGTARGLVQQNPAGTGFIPVVLPTVRSEERL